MEREIKTRKTTLRVRLINYMQARAGEQLFAEDVATTLGTTEDAVLAIVRSLGGDYHIKHGSLKYSSAHRVWYGTAPREEANRLDSRILRWLEKPSNRTQRLAKSSKCQTASVIAKALGEAVETVANELESLHRRGELVRCELVLRSGFDRYEYRLMGVAL